ncbi:MAG: hypothetical protein GWN62_13585, partial [Aliifodinibius sp.]|nr:hypothetical protein [Nitrosopumilaceae archaeon]NIV12258.1 hypothetical protein [Fodinibius sp.]NIX61267.1 hypothetical protein [Nitrosopumilaceae archaeon]
CPEHAALKEIELLEGIILFHHNWKEIPGNEYIPAEVMVLDYSSTDSAIYPQMMTEVQETKTEQNIIEVAQKYVNIYNNEFKIDPIRRLKHRAMNLFLPLNVDIQNIRSLWQKKNDYEIERVFRELIELWKGSAPYSRSPYAELLRLWYMLVGEELEWTKLGSGTPHDVYLPKDRSGKEQPLLFWLANFYSDTAIQQLEPWLSILKISGLIYDDRRYEVNDSACILNFTKVIHHIVSSGKSQNWLHTLSALASDEDNSDPLRVLWRILSGLETNEYDVGFLFDEIQNFDELKTELAKIAIQNYQIKIRDFSEWLNSLNKHFEKLQMMEI